jgi:O-antigen/teichoic acid export membrane protein
MVFSQVDLVLLSSLRTTAETGLYGASRRLAEPLELISAGVGLSLLPVMSRVGAADKGRLARLYRKSVVSLLLVAFPLAFFLMTFARPLVGLLFGPEFAPSAQALAVLGFYLPFIFVFHMGSCVFIALHRQKMNSLIWLGGLAMFFALNAVLIPTAGFLGASWTRLVTAAAVAGASVVIVRRHLGPLGLRPVVAVFVLAAALTAALRLGLEARPLAAAGAFVALFGAGAIALRVVTAEDVRFFKAEILSVLRREPDRLADA